ncbi:MAG: hypothetical protein ACJ746_18905 [Bryobacteraceae bacterium]
MNWASAKETGSGVTETFAQVVAPDLRLRTNVPLEANFRFLYCRGLSEFAASLTVQFSRQQGGVFGSPRVAQTQPSEVE